MTVPDEIWVTIRWVAGAGVRAFIACLIGPFFGSFIGGVVARIFDL